MYIKPSTVIPPGTKITRLEASTTKVKSTYSLLKAEERKLGAQAELAFQAKQLTRYLEDGYSVAEAIKLILG